MTTGAKITRLAAIKRQSLQIQKRINKLVIKKNGLISEEGKIIKSISASDRSLFAERLEKVLAL